VKLGRTRLEERYPELAPIILTRLPEPALARFLANLYKNKHVRFPHASDLFPGLQPQFDEVLTANGYLRDTTLCETMAALDPIDQREFYERYQKDPVIALRWAKLPRWKRPLVVGDSDDRQIWKFFVMFRLAMENNTEEPLRRLALFGQGDLMARMATVLSYVKDLQRLSTMLGLYGSTLMHHRSVGNASTPPWEERPTS
jgi:hypothetical protein